MWFSSKALTEVPKLSHDEDLRRRKRRSGIRTAAYDSDLLHEVAMLFIVDE